jgi:hypothetical protein
MTVASGRDDESGQSSQKRDTEHSDRIEPWCLGRLNIGSGANAFACYEAGTSGWASAAILCGEGANIRYRECLDHEQNQQQRSRVACAEVAFASDHGTSGADPIV